MFGTSLTGLDRTKLRRWLALFFVALLIPTVILIQQAYRQMKWEVFHQYHLVAEELATRINARVTDLIRAEEARSFSDYAFLVVAGDPAANFLQRSPLSGYPVDSEIPGLIGYFQIDAQGNFSTPLLPQAETEPAVYGVSADELHNRQVLVDRIRIILSENRLVQAGPAAIAGGSAAGGRQRRDRLAASIALEEDAADHDSLEEQVLGQAAFDRLNKAYARREPKTKQEAASTLGRVEDLKLDERYQSGPTDEIQRTIGSSNSLAFEKRSVRKERSTLPEPQIASSDVPLETETLLPSAIKPALRISTFESEIDPFEFSLLDSGHLVLFRKVWRDEQRYIQGSIIDQRTFLQGVIETMFRATALSQMSDLIIAYQGDVLSAFSGQASRGYLSSASELGGALLYQTRLSAPLNETELIFSINQLPSGPAGTLISWVALVFGVVLCSGFLLMYRLGARQIDLTRQQQDFVSAVSHELKTPLTSIRMYGDLLREGWASEDKKKTYYDYICDESERLSRLIANVLQLARMTRNDLQIDLKPLPASALADAIRSKISSQIERAGFELHIDCDERASQSVIEIDADYFTQIIINLADNAIKFSARAEEKRIDISCSSQGNHSILFTVRDYGPGIPGDQMKKIFTLFYRSGNELTRETVGTGIGLALVHQLTVAMKGAVDVVNKEPGAEFRLVFPVCDP